MMGIVDVIWKLRGYPCEDISEKDLLMAVELLGRIKGQEEVEKVRRCTCRISEEEIPWSSIRHLCVLGKEKQSYNVVAKTAQLDSGFYINRRGNCLLLIHPKYNRIRSCVNQCGDRLVAMGIYNALFTELDVGTLTGLASLTIYGCKELTGLSGLEKLVNLTELYVSECGKLNELPGLENLVNLTVLDLSLCTRLTELPGLENLVNLTELDLSGCFRLTGLPDLGNLGQVTNLNLSWSYFSRLPDGIRSMKKLRRLNLENMKLETLPDWLPEIAESFTLEEYACETGRKGAVVYLFNTTVEDIPDMSIFEQHYKVVAEWFQHRQKGTVRTLNEIKVVFLGDGEAGKSHTIARLMNDGGDPVDYMDQSTPGIVIRNKEYEVDGRKFTVHYWDFGGQEIMHSMHRIFLTGRTMYVILLNARDDTQGDRARYWLHNVKSFAPDAPVLLVLNKIDQNENASVDEPYLRGQYDKLTQVVRLSAKEFSQERFNEEFTDVLKQEILKTGYLDAQWPISWTNVKTQLENMTSHYIMGSAYEDICAECQVDQNRENLLHWFNDLGVSFCCRDEGNTALEDYVILRPDWITNALYIILFNKLEGVQNGLIPHNSIHSILKRAHRDLAVRCTLREAKYEGGDIGYVLGVMRKFNLSFPHGTDHEFIPMLCQQNSTVDIAYYQKDAEVLEFNMDFDYLPNNLLHRLMVERHMELDMENVWRTGAHFQLKELGLSAVVVIDGNLLRFFIRHTNADHRPNTYLTMLKANVDRIVDKMGLKAPTCQLIYKLDGKVGSFEYEDLRQAWEDGEREIYARTWRRRIPIQDIFNQSAPDGLEDERKLLNAIHRSCQYIQGESKYRLVVDSQGKYVNGRDMEDFRNRRVRDDLEKGGYNVKDQTQQGGGELDLLLYNEKREPWTIIECLREDSGAKTDWNKHLDKLLGKYNFFGARFAYLLTYVDADPRTFDRIWKGYQSYLKTHSPASHDYVAGSYMELNEKAPQYIKTAKCRYTTGTDDTTVYHIFVRIDKA